MTEQTHRCLSCQRSSDEVPLLAIEFRGKTTWICSQHLPILIHKPEQLTGMLPGADALAPAEHED